ncbi:MAG TPA: ATP-dependent zinc metalloprotease FtsH [Rectinemataceae bacterium]
MKVQPNPRKPLMYYYGVVMLVVFILNAYLMPSLMQKTIVQTDYRSFLTLIEQGKVKKVQMETDRISFIASGPEGKDIYYMTGRVEDPSLVERLYASGAEFGQAIPKQNSPLVSILNWVLPIALFVGLGQLFQSRMGGRLGGMGNAMAFGNSKAKIYVEAQTGKSFADVAGQDEAKEALKEIVDFLHQPEKYKEIGALVPKGALLVGPPGTGKTLLAKAVAGESKVPFFSISGSEFVEMFVGMGAARVRDLFKQAKEKAPCIVFIDEIDTIGKSRNSGAFGGNDEREQTLNQLLSEMYGFEAEDKGVVILAATNRPETLDKALLRPGRFDRRIPVELPDLAGRQAILEVHAKKVKLGEGVDFNAIARATSGASGADLANIINEAALRAVKMGRKEILQADLEESVEVVIAGYQRKNAVISDKDKRIIAYHEIGHALVAAMQKDSAPVHKITIVPRTSGALGYTMQVDETERILLSKEQAQGKIAVLMGGRAAEEIVFGSITSGASNDIEQATRLARAMVTRFGMSEAFGMMALETVNNPYLGGDTTLTVSPETAARVDEEILKIINASYSKAKEILQANRQTLDELTECLLKKETLTGEEFMAVLKKEKECAIC